MPDLPQPSGPLSRLFSADGIAVDRYDCAGGCQPAEEVSGRHEIVFVLTGCFVRVAAAGRSHADPARVLFFRRGDPYRVEHPVGRDACLVLALPDATLVEAAERRGWSRDADHPFPLPDAPCPSGLLARAHALARRAALPASPLELAERALDLTDGAFGAGPPPVGRRSRSRRTRALHREQVEAVQVALAREPAAAHQLPDLARAVASSPFHLARVFRRETGVSIHGHLTRLRLGLALDRLDHGEEDLSALAHDLGFADHSHFARSFRRAFGTTPSAYRRGELSRDRPGPRLQRPRGLSGRGVRRTREPGEG